MAIESALIVDDSKLARITLRKKLARFGIAVEVAESAAEAFEKLNRHRPDIVFMDHLMPEKDGFEMTMELRKMHEFTRLPIVMCTGKDHEGYLEEARAIGANAILTKPPTEDSLNTILNQNFFPEDVDPVRQPPGEFAVSAMSETTEIENVAAADQNEDSEIRFDDDVLKDLQADIEINEEGESQLDNLLTDLLMDTHVEEIEAEVASDSFEDAGIPVLAETVSSPQAIRPETEAAAVLERPQSVDLKAVDQRIEQKLALQEETLTALVISTLQEEVQAATKQSQRDLEKLLVSRIEQEGKSLSEDDVNQLVVKKIQTVWKKSATQITQTLQNFRQHMLNSEASSKAFNEERFSAVDHRIDELKALLETSRLTVVADEETITTPASSDIANQLDDLALGLVSIESELDNLAKSSRMAKFFGFLGFVVGASSLGYLVATYMQFL